jgi:hypothetical protein
MKFKNQAEMFMHIWNERPHVSEISGEPLLPKGHPQHHWQYAHVLGKGAYPSYKLNSDNIMLVLPHEHEMQEEFEIFRDKHDELRRRYYKEIYNKEFE